MNVAFTSRESLRQIVAELPQRQSEVYLAIAHWADNSGTGPSIEDLARVTGRKECSICGRISELKKAGVIEVSGSSKNLSGAMADTYRALVYREFNLPSKAAAQTDLFGETPKRGISPYATRM